MASQDFDVAELAAFLHLTPQQVTRLAERDRLPGRKVAGDWRFSRSEIHHWFEDRIGLSDEEQLVEVESVLQRNAPAHHQDEVSIADLLPVQAIAVPLHARTRDSVIRAMVDLAAGTGLLWEPDTMADAVRRREEMHPTALDIGVALMHPRRPMTKILGQAFLALGVTQSGIPFGAGVPMSDVFWLICSTDDRRHLQILARLSRVLTAPGFLGALHRAADAKAVHELIVETERELT
jgi:PTS system nitrogen regulatory IIA component